MQARTFLMLEGQRRDLHLERDLALNTSQKRKSGKAQAPILANLAISAAGVTVA